MGKSQIPSNFVLLLVFADNFCKKYRPIICPNYGVINKIASEYKPGSEMKGVALYNFEPWFLKLIKGMLIRIILF